MTNFQIVLYYKKRVVIDGKPSIKTMIDTKKKFASANEIDIDSILDKYIDDKREKGTEKILETYVLIDDDEDFIESVLEIETSEDFVEWNERSKKVIEQKIANL